MSLDMQLAFHDPGQPAGFECILAPVLNGLIGHVCVLLEHSGIESCYFCGTERVQCLQYAACVLIRDH
jgi:hypothetical protein